MNDHAPRPRNVIRRHPLASLAGLSVIGIALWIAHFLATFDLNQYRDYLANEISQQLQLPVQIGQTRLEVRENGIALRFNDLSVGTADTPIELHTKELWLQLAWRGLLLRKPLFSEVALGRPHLRISPATTAPAAETPAVRRSPEGLLRDLKISRVEIQQGDIDYSWLTPSGTTRSLQLGNLTLNLGDLGLERAITFEASGDVPGQAAPARLTATGSITVPGDGSWDMATWDCVLQGKDLAAAWLVNFLPENARIQATGALELQLYLKGQANAGTIQAEVSGQRLRIRPHSAYQQAIPLRHLQISGTWERTGDLLALRQVALQIDDLRVAGEITLSGPPAARTVNGKLSNGSLPVDTLRRWLPASLLDNHAYLSKLQPGGVLTVQGAVFHATLPEADHQRFVFHLDSLDGEATQLAWLLEGDRRLGLNSVTVHLADGQWRFARGNGTLAGIPLAFSGTLTQPQPDSPLRFAFDLDGLPTAEQLAPLWPEPRPAELVMNGALQVRAQLAGTPELMTLVCQFDLSHFSVDYADLLHLPATAGAELLMHGLVGPDTLTIEQATLAYPPLSGSLSGSLNWSDPLLVDLSSTLQITDLKSIYPLLPAADKLQLQGGVTLDVALHGPANSSHPRVQLELHEVSIPTHGVVADISGLNGQVFLEGQGLRTDQLTARLGKSAVTLRAQVADLSEPRLELDVEAPAIRADELIFHSDRTMLRDLHGHLTIDREGIQFSPVKVQLDGGTKATVTGQVRSFTAPQVALDIVGDYANVEEIVGLWSEESAVAKAAREARQASSGKDQPKSLPPIRIKVDAREGDLYGMKFTNAKTIIVPTAEQLLLHPLDFNVEEGYCTTQVLVNFTGQEPVIRVSGHAENVDAYAIYNQLLHRKSLMRGRLRADFYLQGALGKGRFLPTSYGNINFSVRNGVMRHSPILSTLFSLLNVSQLFQLKLPDINFEGLPFSLLKAEFSIDHGVLDTKQLVIESDAISMSYAGQYDMVRDQLDLLVIAKPLGTVDKVVTKLPIAGWILGGEEKALITAQFKVTGSGEKPEIEAIPISAISKGILGVFQRTLGLPLKLIEDPAILWGGGGGKKD